MLITFTCCFPPRPSLRYTVGSATARFCSLSFTHYSPPFVAFFAALLIHPAPCCIYRGVQLRLNFVYIYSSFKTSINGSGRHIYVKQIWFPRLKSPSRTAKYIFMKFSKFRAIKGVQNNFTNCLLGLIK